MGLVPSAGGEDTILDMAGQQVPHVTFADQKNGPSDAPDRSYLIADVKFKTYRNSYPYTSGPTPNETYVDNCSIKPWRCSDKDMWVEGAPWYWYIWWHKFYRYGHAGLLRHQLLQRLVRSVALFQRHLEDMAYFVRICIRGWNSGLRHIPICEILYSVPYSTH